MPKLPLPLVCLAACVALVAPACAQTAAKTEEQLHEEVKQAEDFYQQHKMLEALPLYEDLHTRYPDNAAYTERLAMAWVGKGGAESSSVQTAADNKHALDLMKQAEAQGDHSNLLEVMIEKLSAAVATPPVAAPTGPLPAGRETFNQAESVFSKGDIEGADKLYKKSWEENPSFYSAPLFAGDMEFRLGHYDEAGVWFAKAIAISPDTETAHRYWGDALAKAGKSAEARRQYIEAFIADPYQKAPRLQLRSFAQMNHMQYVPPPITLPPPPTKGKDGGMVITVDPAKANDPITTAWLGYPMQTLAWQNGRFAKTYPNEKTYRHSLAEESDSLRMMLKVVQSLKIPEDKYDATIRSLFALEKDGMLECWILLDAPDQGTAQDYAAFRAAHRELLRAYIEKYDLHPA
jgi:tetratricopeptide (TPR) repeat protein